MKIVLIIGIILGLCTLANTQGFCVNIPKDSSSIKPVDFTIGRDILIPTPLSLDFAPKASPVHYSLSVRGITVKNKNRKNEVTGLDGYIHLILDLSEFPEEYTVIFIQAQDTGPHASVNPKRLLTGIGEFVPDFPFESCPDVKKDLESGDFIRPTKYQYPICQKVHRTEPLPSNMFIYNVFAEPSVSPRPSKKVHLFWKITNYYCNHPVDLRFRLGMAADHVIPAVIDELFGAFKDGEYHDTLVTLSNVLSGAPDPIPLPSGLEIENCDIPLPNALFPWVQEVFESGIEPHSPLQHCPGSIAGGNVRCSPYTHVCFKQDVDPGTQDFSNYMDYDDYVESIVDKINVLNKCPPLPIAAKMEPELLMRPSKPRTTTTTTEPPVIFNDSIRVAKELEQNRRRGIQVDKFPGSVVWNYRVLHGIGAIVSTLFVTPVSNFMTRYYKETFMDQEILFNRVWYMVHLISVLVNLLLHFYGQYSAVLAKRLLGKSKTQTADIHRKIGWISIILYLSMALLGGFRPWSTKFRKVVIGSHWAVGICYYLLCLVACGMSVFIPGSPSATSDTTVEENGWQWILALICIWFIVDIVFHVVMIIHACLMDSLLGLKRDYLPEPIPVLDEDDDGDGPGYVFRKRVLIVYVVTSFILTSFICIWMIFHTRDGRGFGPMTCTHDDSGQLKFIPEACGGKTVV